MQQLRHQGELSKDAIPQAAFGNIQQMSAEIAHDPTGVALQLFQCFAHVLELLGMGVAAKLPAFNPCLPIQLNFYLKVSIVKRSTHKSCVFFNTQTSE